MFTFRLRHSNSRNILVPLVVSCAMFMEQVDGSIIATALPKISQSLQTDPVHLNLAITSYMFSLAVFIPLSGWIADRFGARNVFRLAIVLFIVGSLACGLSNTLWQLVAARVLQGFGGAMMVPVGRLILLRSIPKAKLVDALALMTAPALIGPVLGPPIGGIIVTYTSWRWIFLINVPMGIIGYLAATKWFENIRGRQREPLDFFGFVIMAFSLAGLMFGFETAGRDIVSGAVTAGVTLAGLFGFGLYLRHIRNLSHPIIDFRPLLYQTYRAAIISGSFFRIAIGAMPFLVPLLLQYGFGLSPAMSGFVTIASAAGACVMKPAAKPLIRLMGFKPLLIINAILNALFFAGFAGFDKTTSMGVMFAFLLVGGLFRSLHFTAMNSLAYAEIPERLLSRANTLYSTIQQLTLGLGVAVGALALSFSSRWHGSSDLQIQEFTPAFMLLAALCVVSALDFIPLPKNAGAIMRGITTAEEEGNRKDPS